MFTDGIGWMGYQKCSIFFILFWYIPSYLSKYSKIVINIPMGLKTSGQVGVMFKNFKVTSGGGFKDFWLKSSLFEHTHVLYIISAPRKL